GARVVTRLDTEENLAILPFDAPEAAQFVVFLTEDQLEHSWQLIECDGKRLTEGPAAVRLMELLRPVRWLGKLCRSRPLTRLVGAVDHLIKVSRPKLSHVVPQGPGPRRWP
ncbi:MAG TPA: hypothetical protein VHJ76_04655, partial [Actinomycetota bacterium]|nr:hypothetical protein [Actinomycetota bacterium]